MLRQWLLKMHFNIIPACMHWSSKQSFSNKNYVCTSHLLHMCYMSNPPYPSPFHYPINCISYLVSNKNYKTPHTTQKSSTTSCYWSELITKIIFSIINMCNSRVKKKRERERKTGKENVDKSIITWLQKPKGYLGAQGCYQFQSLVGKVLINIYLI